jgi:1,4-dihydroxy-2-naphthoate octaprenyltransferase
MKKYGLSLKIINELVEFRTSVGIITSVLMGTGYSYYMNKSIKPVLLLAVLSASILLDGAATVFNHYFDYRKARNREGYLYNVHNPIVAHGLNPLTAFFTGAFLVGVAGLLGLYIVLSTSWVLLPVGGISILIAYFYSAGKHPISYTPFGELVSGLFEGSIVFGISYFIQSMSYSPDVLLVSLPVTLSISNIMLANNTSDVEEDEKNGRRTLPIIIGQDNGVRLLYITHILMFGLNTIYIISGKLPLSTLLIYLLLPMAVKNLITFDKNRTKACGFVFILRNTILFNVLEIAALWAWAIFKP